MIDLAGIWSLRDEHGEYACDMPIPGDAHSALLTAGLIPDPYVGRNELAVRGLADRDWVASRTFVWDGDHAGITWYLDVDFLDTVTEIHLNGQKVETAQNTFRRYRRDVSRVLKPGENHIEIQFKSNTRAATTLAKELPYKIPYIVQNCPIPDGNMLRKPQCHFGWDWNLAIAPFGLYGRIKLQKMDAARIEHVQTHQLHNADGSVDVEVVVTLTGSVTSEVPIAVNLSAARLSSSGLSRGSIVQRAPGSVEEWILGTSPRMTDSGRLSRGNISYSSVLRVADPRFWWPVGQGRANSISMT